MVVDNLPNPSGHPDCTMYTLCTGMYLRMLCIGTKSFNFYFSDSPEWTGTGTPNILEPPSSGFHRFNENEVWVASFHIWLQVNGGRWRQSQGEELREREKERDVAHHLSAVNQQVSSQNLKIGKVKFASLKCSSWKGCPPASQGFLKKE